MLGRISDLGEKGYFGEEAKSETVRYANIPNDIGRSVIFINDFFSENVDEDTKAARNLLCQMIVVAYRDAKKKDAAQARAFANAFIEDIPTVLGSALLPRWVTLAETSFAYKNDSKSENPSLVWNNLTKLVLATNEFLDGLIGLLIIAWRCALGKTVNTNVLGNNYGSKVNEFAELTKGENGPFYLFFRMADPKLRNSIAHSSIWLDSDEKKVRYIVGQQEKTEYEMDLMKFMSMAYLGSHLASAYVAALATIVVLEDSGSAAKGFIPMHLVNLFGK